MGNDLIPAKARELIAPEHLEAIENLKSIREVGGSDLVPAESLRDIISALEGANFPCSMDHAKELAKRLIGNYPNPRIDDPEIYLRAIVDVFSKYPAFIGKEAVLAWIDSNSFVPTRDKLVAVCRDLHARYLYTVRKAQAMLDEHERRANGNQPETAVQYQERLNADRRAALSRFKAKHGVTPEEYWQRLAADAAEASTMEGMKNGETANSDENAAYDINAG